MQFFTRWSTLVLALLCTCTVQANPSTSIDLSADHCAGDISMAAPACLMTTWYASPNGGTNAAGTRADPLALQSAFNSMSGGDEVVLLDGTYFTDNEVGIYFRSGTAGQPTLIRAENRWGAKISTTAQYQAFTIQDSDYVTVDGIEVEITDPSTQSFTNTSGFSTFRSNHITIKNCYAHDFGCNGFSFQSGDYFTLENSVARDNAKQSQLNCSGISIYQPKQLDQNDGYHMIIRNNVSFENEVNIPFVNGDVSADQPTDGNGIILDDFNNTQNGSTNGKFTGASLIENNLCYNNGGAGIKVFETENVMVRNNTCWHNLTIMRFYDGRFGEIDVAFTVGADITVANNIAVAANTDNVWAMNYTPAINPSNGYLQRYSNLFVGTVRMPGDNFWDAYGDDVQAGNQQGYPGFANPTVTLSGGFNSVRDFDQYFRLTAGSPAVNSAYTGQDWLGRNVFNDTDLEGDARPQGDARDKGCYEGTGDGGDPGFADDVVSVTAPSEFSPGQTFQVTVNYSASTTRDIAVRLEDPQNSYAQRANEGRQTVNAGTGTITFNLTAFDNVAIANNRYQIQTLVTETGGWWNERKDNFTTSNVSCVAGGNGNDVIGEVGSSSANANWTTVTLNNSYADPVVIIGALGMYGGQAATTRVRNVTSTSFQWRVDEWEYLDEGHNAETLSYMVVEAGRHTLANGAELVAGNLSVGTGYKTATYSALTATPTVFTSVNTENEAQAVNVRVRSVTSSDFQMQLQEEENGGTENGSRSHVEETVGWVVIGQGTSSGSGTDKFEAFTTANNVTQNNRTVNFEQSYGNDRQLFLHSQTRDGGDAGKMRFRHNDGYTGSQMKIFFQEEQSKDTELSHTTEAAGYLIFDTKGDIVGTEESARVAQAPQSERLDEDIIGPGTAEGTLTANLYPNPSQGQFTIALNLETTATQATLEVLDLTGRQVLQRSLALPNGLSQQMIDLTQANASRGVYLVRITDAQGAVLTAQRLLVQ